MKVASLFSGVGGFELGLGDHYSLALLNDIDPQARQVLRQHWPHVLLTEDVRELTARTLSSADLLVAGFPCQDVSIVGGQRGLDGERTSLVKNLIALAEGARPDWMLFENVQSIRFVHGGRVLSYLINEVERLGYRWAYRILDSRGFGLPQRRRRFYFLASRVDDPAPVLLSDGGRRLPTGDLSLDRPIGFYWTEGRAGHGLTADAIPPLKAGSAIGIASPPAVLFPNGQVMLPTIETAEVLQGFPKGWTQAAAARSRWQLVGNSVSPPVIAWIAGKLAATSEKVTAPEVEMPADPPWPIAGRGSRDGGRYMLQVEEAPNDQPIGQLSKLDLQWRPISFRALSGFVERARDSRLKYPAGFLDRLDKALAAIGFAEV